MNINREDVKNNCKRAVMKMFRNRNESFDIPLGLSMAMAQNPSVFEVFESLDNEERKSLAGLQSKESADLTGRIRGIYPLSDSFGRTRML